MGAYYEEIKEQDNKIEMNIIDLKEEENTWKNDNEEEDKEDDEVVENVVLEAKFVASKIKELIDKKYQVFDKKKKRDIQFRDIAVLLRSPNNVAPIYEKEIAECGITVYSDSSESYLESIEIDTIMSLLKIINNPMQDIPLVTVLRSVIGNFTDNELIEISLVEMKKQLSFYDKLTKYAKDGEDETLRKKIKDFINCIEKWREDEEYKSLDELIWQIYSETGYMDYVSLLPNGELKVANLKMLFEKAKQYESASFKGLHNFIKFMDNVKSGNSDKSAAKIIGENENVVRIMSIHKSKGLEFPVVILAGTNKNFNFQDLNKQLLFHQNLGLGPQYIDATRHIEFKTLAKTAISIKAKQEVISEEMRLLYVALTRAKEKLIITGINKDANKAFTEKQMTLDLYKDDKKINPFLVQKCKSYLDWLELVYLKENSDSTNHLIDLNIISKSDLLKNKSKEKKDENIVDRIKDKAKKNKNEKEEKKLKELIDWKYNFSVLENVPNKTAVTKIEKIKMESIKSAQDEEIKGIEERVLKLKPKFLNDEDNITLTGAEKGTLMHLCIQKMNEKQDYDVATIKNMINELVKKDLITKAEAKYINISQLLLYTKSELWKDLELAKEIYKEQPFYANVFVNELYGIDANDENVLVQGIIDLYYIDKNDRLVLVDYKTDHVEDGMEYQLAERYRVQLEFYKNALEQALKRKVELAEIYSIRTGKTAVY